MLVLTARIVQGGAQRSSMCLAVPYYWCPVKSRGSQPLVRNNDRIMPTTVFQWQTSAPNILPALQQCTCQSPAPPSAECKLPASTNDGKLANYPNCQQNAQEYLRLSTNALTSAQRHVQRNARVCLHDCVWVELHQNVGIRLKGRLQD
jgi:hypothetical protein